MADASSVNPVQAANNLFHLLMKACERFPIARKVLLLSPNTAGFTPLHQVAANATLDMVSGFFRILQESLSHQDLYYALTATTRSGYKPSSSKRNKNAQDINAFLNQKRAAYAQNMDPRDDRDRDRRGVDDRGRSISFPQGSTGFNMWTRGTQEGAPTSLAFPY
jgi:hypothetical protein